MTHCSDIEGKVVQEPFDEIAGERMFCRLLLQEPVPAAMDVGKDRSIVCMGATRYIRIYNSKRMPTFEKE